MVYNIYHTQLESVAFIMKKKTKEQYYVNNKDFMEAVVEYVKSVNVAKKKNKEIPIIPHYIGECFLKIAEGLSHKPSFYSYSYREEMVMDGVENCVKAITNYDVEASTRSGKPNPFGYFTQIIWYAFLRRIAKEKKQQDIKEKYIAQANIEAFMYDDGNDINNSSMIEKMRVRYEEY